jgi:RNA recognition motif-containing protein
METSKLFVGGISWNVDSLQLKDIFSEVAEVKYAKIINDRETGKSRGFGFVEFNSVEDAAKAKEEFDGAEIDGRTVKVDFAEDRRNG